MAGGGGRRSARSEERLWVGEEGWIYFLLVVIVWGHVIKNGCSHALFLTLICWEAGAIFGKGQKDLGSPGLVPSLFDGGVPLRVNTAWLDRIAGIGGEERRE
ncbi:hypothetical protein B0T18DRAFT_390679 [Schizothecium vesticola]|uniref:Uncharacterized protein n=1 Tax=Schizothecium vesticola TaxID=314040 RepID=A0AA40EVA9_9PEZI|nr:hypothetical protein B0T18DRAFT_390679 [Schizothecium vesticola]